MFSTVAQNGQSASSLDTVPPVAFVDQNMILEVPTGTLLVSTAVVAPPTSLEREEGEGGQLVAIFNLTLDVSKSYTLPL